MKVAIPVWQSRVSPVFDTAGRLLVVEVENGAARSSAQESLVECSFSGRISRLTELGVDVLLCGAISTPMAQAIEASGVRIVPWISGEVSEVLREFVVRKSMGKRFVMPGRQRCRRRAGNRRKSGTESVLPKHPEETL
ncbi:NifB/NifX family molybdenum-iron cluster-binding protein [Candidatus Poribacteria bacterium]|nr:NifB/NifX family molybdenum-iron cluster-binding protein [Candidatus Poribacteria bacterium]